MYGRNRESKLVKNYIKTLKEFKTNNFKIFNINNIPSYEKMIWAICYEPLMGFNCTIPNEKKDGWNLVNTKKTYLENSKLFKRVVNFWESIYR